MARTPKCPTCKEVSAARPDNPAFPFCSPRCKLADLGAWLEERYVIPVEPAGDPDELLS